MLSFLAGVKPIIISSLRELFSWDDVVYASWVSPQSKGEGNGGYEMRIYEIPLLSVKKGGYERLDIL